LGLPPVAELIIALMGVVRGTAALLIEHYAAHPARGRLLQLGRQEIFFSRRELDHMLAARGFQPANRRQLDAMDSRHRPLTDVEFFGIFGFDCIESLDFGGYGEASLEFDMNQEVLPEQWRGRYHAVFDGGTMEHVFHVPNFLRNVGDLLAPGGCALHMNPASNSVDHGFYCFSPCLYYEYYLANKYEIRSCALIDLGTRLRPIRMRAYSYLPPIARNLLDGRLNGHVHWVWCAAEKRADSTRGRIPQQGFYQGLWREEAEAAASPSASPGAEPGGSILLRVKRFVKSQPGLSQAVRKHGLPVLRMHELRQARSVLGRLSRWV
jgi:hypothetical protein